jgi:hypothetical protein
MPLAAFINPADYSPMPLHSASSKLTIVMVRHGRGGIVG